MPATFCDSSNWAASALPGAPSPWGPISLVAHLCGHPFPGGPISVGAHLPGGPSPWRPISWGAYLHGGPSPWGPISLEAHLLVGPISCGPVSQGAHLRGRGGVALKDPYTWLLLTFMTPWLPFLCRPHPWPCSSGGGWDQQLMPHPHLLFSGHFLTPAVGGTPGPGEWWIDK